MITVVVFICEGCHSPHGTCVDIASCDECHKEICNICSYGDCGDLCKTCFDASEAELADSDDEHLEPATERTFMEDFLDHSEPDE